MPNEQGHPTAFISYSWDSEGHKKWVRDLATKLRADGVDVVLDQWHCAPGDQLPAFMEKAIRESDFTLIVCTPTYKHKSETRTGGAGYEEDVISGDVLAKGNHRKYIPILRGSDAAASMPSQLAGKLRIDLRGSPYSQIEYQTLLKSLHGQSEQAPPIGKAPASKVAPPTRLRTKIVSGFQTDPRRGDSGRLVERNSASGSIVNPRPTHGDDDPDNFKPITIEGIVEDRVGKPRNDGTPGCALYRVPFRLSRTAPEEWGRYFVYCWDHPQSWTSSHRPGIARVYGDEVMLTETDLDEVKRVHRDTLKQCLDFANTRYVAMLRKRRETANQEAAERHEWAEQVRKQADDFRIG